MSPQTARFQCPLCPRNYTRAFNLRNHISAHSGDKPFVCTVCGRAFTRNNDRKTHEELHAGELKWPCKGPLKNGDRWGCGRRFGRKSNLMRHFRSKTGRKCIEPLLEEQDLQSNSVLQIPVAQNDLQGCLAYFPWPHAEQVKAKNTLSRCSDTDKSSDESSAQPESDWQHTVATNRLFSWPAVKALIGPLDYDPEYLMKLERKQENDGMTSQSDTSPNSCPFPGDKGHSQSSVVQDGSSGVYHTAFDNDQDAEINSLGQLQLTGDVIWRYYQSYLDRIHNLHPFLEGPRLDVDIKEFIKWYCPRKLSPAIIIDTPPRYSYPEMKGTTGSIGESPLVMSRRFVEPSYDHIVFLLIFAVGAICERNLEFTDQKTTLSYSSSCVPGLDMYRYATSAIDHIKDVGGLGHVEACLLAGIYNDQLKRPFQSHDWISQAAKSCHVLIQMKKIEEFQGCMEEYCKFIYWSCLQLESDLLTELDVPASGISRYEHHIPFPREKSTIVAPENDLASRITVMMIYSGQVYLHKSLNRVYANLYNGKHQGQKFWSLSCVQEAESVNLDLWRFSLPKEMRWNDDEDPAKDIGNACLRAKYYRARYMIHRPLLYNVLHYEPPPCLACDDNPPTASTLSLHTQSLCDDFHAQHNDNDTDSMRKNFPFEYWKSPKIELSDLPSKLRRACKVCVDSAIRHTTAFDGIENGLVVTNIFGIAHAQFGNMLTLAVTYHSSLSKLIERGVFEPLLQRTIGFLMRHGINSPVLCADARTLIQIYSKLFGHPPVLP